MCDTGAMMQAGTAVRRKIITIDADKCDGCGDCLPSCPEGAIQVIEGKARLVSDLCCDGLGACLGHCPQNAITIEERDAAPYDERRVMANLMPQGEAVIRAHLDHLRDHAQTEYLREAEEFLSQNRVRQEPVSSLLSFRPFPAPIGLGGCPGSRSQAFPTTPAPMRPESAGPTQRQPSRLTHWPIQLHLINPQAPHFRESDLLLVADCVPFALAGFHQDYLNGKTLTIACPKLDEGQDVYVEKLQALVELAGIRSLTVMIMQVPCCGGLLRLARTAVARSTRKLAIRNLVVSLQGAILKDEVLDAA
jgi:ferredoxin